MKYLVDANVLSEGTKPSPDRGVLSWLRRYESDMVIDAVILGELHYGILVLPRGQKRTRLEQWFQSGVQRLQCLPWKPETGLRWAQLLAGLHRIGKTMPLRDSLIAATALVHGLTMVTRNRSDFEKAGLMIVNPFST